MSQDFFKSTESKTRMSLPARGTALNWQRDQRVFLEVLQSAIARGRSDGVAEAWQQLCQRYGQLRPLTDWEMVFRELHAACRLVFNPTVTAQQLALEAAQQQRWREELAPVATQALPAVVPMLWQVLQCQDVSAADSQTSSLATPTPVGAEITRCTLLYWGSGDQLQFRYCQSGQKPMTVTLASLRTLSHAGDPPDALVTNLLALLTLQDVFHHHPRLNPDDIRGLLCYLQQQTWLPVLSTSPADEKLPRIVCQKTSTETMYYGQWFITPPSTLTPLDPLIGEWQVVYPQPEMTPIEIADSQGWIRLQPGSHDHLLALLARYDNAIRQYLEQQRQRQLTPQLRRCYAEVEQAIEQYAPPAILIDWHISVAECAARQQCWLPSLADGTLPPPPSAIWHGCAALALVERSGQENTQVSAALDAWALAQTRHSLLSLLPAYQKRLYDAWQPLQRPTGKTALTDLQRGCALLPSLSWLAWLAPEAAKTAYADFNRACQQRQRDIISQLKALAAITEPTPAQQSAYRDWQALLKTLLHTWNADGYEAQADDWQQALRAQLPDWTEIPGLQAQVLTGLEQGMATIAPHERVAEDKSARQTSAPIDSVTTPQTNPSTPPFKPLTIPSAWEEAHALAISALQRYAAQRQTEAFQGLQNRYKIRLRSYQTLCAELSRTQTAYQPLADWLQSRLAQLQALTLAHCQTLSSTPQVWAWQSQRQVSASQSPTDWLQQVCKHLETLLPDAPCPFSLLGMRASDKPQSWRLHVLVADSTQTQLPYFKAYQQLLQLYHALLPVDFLPLAEAHSALAAISVSTPQTLAHHYAPLWQKDTTARVNAYHYLPVFHHASRLLSKLATPSEFVGETARRTGMYTLVHEDSSTVSTPKVAGEVEFPKESGGDDTSLLGIWAASLSRRLSANVAQGQAEENAIRRGHHALPTQTLVEIEDDKSTVTTPPISPTRPKRPPMQPHAMLKRRLDAQRDLRQLWQTQQQQGAPAAAILAYLTVHYPAAISHYLTTVLDINTPTQDTSPDGFAPLTDKADSKDSSDDKTTPSHTPTSTPLALRVYRRLPRLLKPVYIDSLRQHWQAASSTTTLPSAQQTLLTQLRDDADSSGWCARQLEETLSWEKSLRRLLQTAPSVSSPLKTKIAEHKTSAYPSVKLSLILDGQRVEGELQLAVVQQLFKLSGDGQWRSKAKGVSGRHQVLRVLMPETSDQPRQALWFKINPEQPGTEYLVEKIDRRLQGFATPPQQLAKICIGDQPPVSVLISAEVAPPAVDPKADASLMRILTHHPERLAKISPLSFVSTLLRVLIIQPEDDKDYFLLPDPDKPGYYRLVCIDNERAFFSPEHNSGGRRSKRELNIKTLIFCLQQMTTDWETLIADDPRLDAYLQHIQQLKPAEVFQDLLRDASDLHDHWGELFSEAEAQQLAQTGLQHKELILPLLMIPPDCEKALLERLYLIQQALQPGHHLTGLSLLGNVQPDILPYYAPLFKSSDDVATCFAQGPGRLYQRDSQGQHCTTLSSVVSLSRQLNLNAIFQLGDKPEQQQALLRDLVSNIWRRQQHSATQALQGVGVWQQRKVLRIEQNLLVLAMSDDKEIKPKRLSLSLPTIRRSQPRLSVSAPMPLSPPSSTLNTTQAEALRHSARLQWQLLPIAERTTLIQRLSKPLIEKPHPDKAQQQALDALYTTLTLAPVTHVSLGLFQATLTDAALLPILKASGHYLLSLDISDCQRLTPNVLKTIAKYCPNLRRLRMRALPWKKAALAHCPHLRWLDGGETLLQALTLEDIPQLKQLSLRECRDLSDVRYLGLDSLSRLEQVDISDCVALIQLRLPASKPFYQLNVNRVGCKTRALIDWLLYLYQRHSDSTQSQVESLSKSPLFTLLGSALDRPEKRLDLTQIKLNDQEFSWLCDLIKLDLPIVELDVGIDTHHEFSTLTYQHEKSEPIRLESKTYQYEKSGIDRMESESITCKMVLLGDHLSGKTSMLIRFIKNDFFDISGTVGASFTTKKLVLDKINYHLNIWDTPGGVCYRSLAKMYYMGANYILICFDITNHNQFKEAQIQVSEVQTKGPTYCSLLALVATKMDLLLNDHDYPYKVSSEEARNYAQENGMLYFECSAKTGEGVNEIFTTIGYEFIARFGEIFLRRYSQPVFIDPELFAEKDPSIFSQLTTKLQSLTQRAESKSVVMTQPDFMKALKSNQHLTAMRTGKHPVLNTNITEVLERNRRRIAAQESSIKEKKSPSIPTPISLESKPETPAPMSDLLSSPSSQDKDFIEVTLPNESSSDKPETQLEPTIPPEKSITTTPPISPTSSDDEIPLTPAAPTDPQTLSDLMQPLVTLPLQDTSALLHTLQRLPAPLIAPWEKQLHRLDSTLTDEPTDTAVTDTVKQLCLQLHYQQRLLQQAQTQSDSMLSPAQAYIQSQPALQQYHDLLLQTLEFGIKASLFGITGRMEMTNVTSGILNASGGALSAIPGIGNTLKAPFAALQFANKLKMFRKDSQISQLFKGARDIETQVAQLAEHMTLAISDELLYDKRTPQRQTALTESSYYQQAKTWFSQQKTALLNWQTLSAAQKQAMLDSSYLLQHLPQLVNSRQFRASKTSVNAYLQILMHDETFTFDADQALTGIKPTLPDQKTTHTSHALLARDKQRYYTQQYQRWLAKLREESEQPLTPTQWQRLQTVLAELEAAALGAEQAQQTVSAQDDFSHLLTDWFDRLQQTTPSAPTQPTERKRELKAPRPTDQPPTLSGLSAPHAQLLSPRPEKPDEKTRALLDEITVALDLAYPPHAIEHSDTRKAYLTQLAEYQQRGVGLTKTDRAQLMQLLCALQDVVSGDCERNFSAG